MSRLARAAQALADLARGLPATAAYARTEHTPLPTLDQMANERESAETRLRRTRWL